MKSWIEWLCNWYRMIYIVNVRLPFLWLPLILLLEDLLPTGFLLQVIVGVGWPVAEQKNFAWLPSLTLMSLVLNLSDISGGTTTSNDATYNRYNRMSLNDSYLSFLYTHIINQIHRDIYLSNHWHWINLAHIFSSILWLNIFDRQCPCVLIIVCYLYKKK